MFAGGSGLPVPVGRMVWMVVVGSSMVTIGSSVVQVVVVVVEGGGVVVGVSVVVGG